MELQWWVKRSWRSIPWTLQRRSWKGGKHGKSWVINFLLSIQFNVYSMSNFVMELNSPFCGTKVGHKWWDTLYIQDHVRIYDIYIYMHVWFDFIQCPSMHPETPLICSKVLQMICHKQLPDSQVLEQKLRWGEFDVLIMICSLGCWNVRRWSPISRRWPCAQG